MPAKRQRTNTTSGPAQAAQCQHNRVQTEPCAHATEIGYTQPTAVQRAKAQGLKSAVSEQFTDDPFTFPAPLILPDDDLALDPKYPSQSLASWARLKDRNAVTSARKTIYIAAPPKFDKDLSLAEVWSKPILPSPTRDESRFDNVKIALDPAHPRTEDIADYVRAFYHPLPVKLLPASSYKFVPWSNSDTSSLQSTPSATAVATIGLRTKTEIVGIRTRPTPHQSVNGFSRQLNLDDVLDAAVSSLPNDAFALLMLVEQDLYEDDDDDFVCGRAYGGSRVAVVSSARYNPMLDAVLELDLEHVWPISHCADYVDTKLKPTTMKKKKKQNKTAAGPSDSLETPATTRHKPMEAAFSAVLSLRALDTPGGYTTTWLSRMCRTIVHELGHCFGIDHCVYYACCMQGSASLHEDARQPPYLCPVDQVKVLEATGASEEAYLKALRDCCKRLGDKKQGDELFTAFAAWIDARLRSLIGVES